jgi:hypothetical protein
MNVNPYACTALQDVEVTLPRHLGITHSRNIKMGGPPAFFRQRDKIFETNYEWSPDIKLQAGWDRAVSCQTAGRNAAIRVAVSFPEISQFVARCVQNAGTAARYHIYRYTFVSGANTNCKLDVTKPSTNKWRQFPENLRLRNEVLG